MTAKGLANREARLAAALKENLKRRKAQARLKTPAKPRADGALKAKILGTAPQAGLEAGPEEHFALEDKPQLRPKAAAKPR